MPNTQSAEKRIRQSARRRARNLWRKRRIKDQVKTLLAAVTSQDAKTAEAEFRKTCGLLDKIASTGTIHKNTAARRKSRLARKVAAIGRAAKA